MATRKYNTDEARLAARRASTRKAARRWHEKHRDTPEYKEKANLRSKRWREENPEAYRQNVRKWQAENPARVREHGRKKAAVYRSRYPERIKAARKAVLERFAGRVRPAACEVCGREPGQKELCADHCHGKGHFRGWLCIRCNFTLGLVDDDPAILRKLIGYLEAAY